MENSSRFFANKACEYYPCHKSDSELNCLFCYCPLYFFDCPGDYVMVEKGSNRVKSCKDCVFPHEPEHYDLVISLLKQAISSPECT